MCFPNRPKRERPASLDFRPDGAGRGFRRIAYSRSMSCFSAIERSFFIARALNCRTRSFVIPNCWPMKTLRVEDDEGWQPRTPAMAAELANHV